MAARFSGPGQPYDGFAEINEAGPRWTRLVKMIPDHINDPIHWCRPRKIFVQSMGDLFHPDIPFADIQIVFDVMHRAGHHTYQILTKRAKRLMEDLPKIAHPRGVRWETCQESNIWIGVTVEDQNNAVIRIPKLQKTPAKVRFLSLEPLLGNPGKLDLGGIHWVIAGCESGPRARPMDLDWIRSIRDQCEKAGVKFYFKQAMINGKRVILPTLDGRKWAELPG